MLEKILPGKLNKFYQETCLLDQQWLLSDDKLSVAKVVQRDAAAAGVDGDVVVTAFARLQTGEGEGEGSK